MKKRAGITRKEPVLLAALVSAVISLAAAFGLRLPPTTMAIIGAVSTLALNTIARRKVGSPNTLADLIEQLDRALGINQPLPGRVGTGGTHLPSTIPTAHPTPVITTPMSPPPVPPADPSVAGEAAGEEIGAAVGSSVGSAVGKTLGALRKRIPFRRKKG